MKREDRPDLIREGGEMGISSNIIIKRRIIINSQDDYDGLCEINNYDIIIVLINHHSILLSISLSHPHSSSFPFQKIIIMPLIKIIPLSQWWDYESTTCTWIHPYAPATCNLLPHLPRDHKGNPPQLLPTYNPNITHHFCLPSHYHNYLLFFTCCNSLMALIKFGILLSFVKSSSSTHIPVPHKIPWV